MLYLDYSREAGDWIPNMFGGRENLEAIDFLRRMNEAVFDRAAGATTVAEESTALPMVSAASSIAAIRRRRHPGTSGKGSCFRRMERP